MRGDQDLVACFIQSLHYVRMKVESDTLSFFLKSSFGLLHVLNHTILRDEALGLVLIIDLGSDDERLLKVEPVDLKGGLAAIVLVQSQ